LGSGDLIVRSLGGKTFEVRDPKTDSLLGGSKTGTVVLNLPASANAALAGGDEGQPQTFPTRFTITELCDDLIVLLEFLRRSTIETVQKFAAYSGTAGSWAGKVCRLLAEPEVKKALEDELARIARRWRHTIFDLHALGPWKERLATYFLVHRCAEVVPGLVETVGDRKQKHKDSKKRVQEIMSKCSRDVDSGRMIVPPRYAKQYAEEQKLQDECAATVKTATTLLKSMAQQMITRLQDPKLLGKAELANLRAIPPLPETLTGLPLADGQLGNLIAPMEELIQTPLGGPPPQAAEVAPSEQYAEGGQDDSHAYAAEGGGEYAAEGAAEAGYAGEAAEGESHSAEGNEVAAAANAAEGSAAIGENGEAAEASTDEATEHPVQSDSQAAWSDEADDQVQYGESEYAQSDVVFGFEPEAAPGAAVQNPPVGEKK
jgi:hypothetical protein